MAINFPSTAGQLTDGSFTYTTGGRTWAWDGVAWESIGVSSTGTDDLAVVTNRGAATNVQLSLDAGFVSGGTSAFTGQTSNLQWTKVDNTLKWGDGSVAIFGANDDLAISHTTADGNRIVALGALEIDSDTISLKNAASTETLIEAVGGASGYVKLYYNNVERVHVSGPTTTISNVLVASGLTYPSTDGLAGQALLTDGSGGLSFGSVSASETLDSVSDRGNTTDQILTTGGLLLSDTKSIVFGAGSDLTIVHTGSKSQIKHSNAGNPLSIESAHDVKILKDGTSDLLAKFVPDGDVKLYHSAIEKLATTATGITVSGVVTATGGTSTNWNTAYGWGDHSTQGYLTSTSAETDPVFVASAAYNITNTKIVNWDAAYAWGDHAAGGYVSLTAISVGTPNAASGNGNITYNSANGEFKFTPQDLSNYLTSYTETSTLANVISRGSTSNNSATIGGNGTTGGVTLSDGVVSVRTGTGNVASIDLYCEVNNAHKVSIKAPLHSNFGGNINFTLPGTHGSVDQVLRTDGSGNTSWVNQTGGTDTNDYVDTASLSGTNLTLGRTGSLADLTVDLSSLGGGSSADPIGTITIWSGTSSNIPTGYQLCDGSASATTELQAIRANVPDLRDRFIVGAGNNYAVDATGGSADAVVVAHEHTTNIDGGHVIPGNGGSSYSYGGAGTYSSTVFNMNSEGVSGTDKNLPPYYALCYIIKNATTSGSGNYGVTPGGSTYEMQYNNSGSFGGTGSLLVSGDDIIFDGASAGKDITFDRSANTLKFANEAKAQFGNTTLFHNSIDLYVQNGVGDIRLEVNSGAPGLWMHRDGSIELYDGNAAGNPQKKFETLASGVSVTGSLDVSSNADITGTLEAGTIDLGDSNKIKLGNSDLYEIYCDSQNLILDHINDGGTTYIRSKQNGNITFDSSDSGNQVAAKFKWSNDSVPVSSAELYQGGVKRLETNASGVNIIGALTVNGSAVGGGGSSVTINDAAPGSPSSGDLWWNSNAGQLKIYYNDGSSSQWVDAAGGGGGGGGISDVVDDTTPVLGGNLDINGKIIFGNGGGITRTSITDTEGFFPGGFGIYAGATSIGWKFDSNGGAISRADGPNSDGTSINALQIGNFSDLSCLTIDGAGTLSTKASLNVAANSSATGTGSKISVGASGELEIFHTSNNTSGVRSSGTGVFAIQNNNQTGSASWNKALQLQAYGDIQIRHMGGADAVYCTAGGAVNLYHGGSGPKIATSATGMKVSGGILDKDDQLGTAGQILSSTGTELDWVDAGSSALEFVSETLVSSNVAQINFSSLQTDTIYRMQGILSCTSGNYGFYFLPSLYDTSTSTQHGPGTSSTHHRSVTRYLGSYLDGASNLDWWVRTSGMNSPAIHNTFHFECEFSTYTFPWLRMIYGTMDDRYESGDFRGLWNQNQSTTYINGLRMVFAGAQFQSPTRIQLFKYVTS